MDKEKRLHLRLDVKIPGKVRLPSSDFLPALIVNLSAGGLKFSCGRDTVHHILPKSQRIPGQVIGVMIEIQFDLQPLSQPLLSVGAIAKVIHSERLAQDVFHVGVQFSKIDAAAAQTLKAYIDGLSKQQPA